MSDSCAASSGNCRSRLRWGWLDWWEIGEQGLEFTSKLAQLRKDVVCRIRVEELLRENDGSWKVGMSCICSLRTVLLVRTDSKRESWLWRDCSGTLSEVRKLSLLGSRLWLVCQGGQDIGRLLWQGNVVEQNDPCALDNNSQHQHQSLRETPVPPTVFKDLDDIHRSDGGCFTCQAHINMTETWGEASL